MSSAATTVFAVLAGLSASPEAAADPQGTGGSAGRASTETDHPVVHAHDVMPCPLHYHNVFGLKLIGVAAVPHHEPRDVGPQGGFGIFYERTLVPEWLELELSANILWTRTGPHVPLDVVFKKPFHVSHRFDPYVGIGAAVTLGLGEERFVAPGIVGTVGWYTWINARWGWLVEFDYAASAEPAPEGWVHEIEGTTGPLVRF